MNPIGVNIMLLVGLLIAATCVHFVLAWMERKGWIWYRTKDRPRPRSLGLIEEIYQPSFEHVIDQEVSEATGAAQTESGDDR